MTEIEISRYKPFIFISGILSIVLPWFYRISFLGVFFTYYNVSIIITDLMYFGLIYLIGLCFNFTFFKYNEQRNFLIGYISWCLTVLGMLGYFFIIAARVAWYEKLTGKNIEIEMGIGYIFAIITCTLITVELYDLRKTELFLAQGEASEPEEKKEEVGEIEEKKENKLVLYILYGVLIILVISILFIFFVLPRFF
jgi:hypothetical protein